MQAFSRALRRFISICVALILAIAVGWFVKDNYGWVFSKDVRGEVVNNERVTNPTSILSGRPTPEMLHSYTVLIRSVDGQLYTASTEDRQWAVIKPGYCVVARLYPYPPWELERGGTYGNARVIQVFDCPGKTPTPDEKSVAPDPAKA